MQINTSIHYIVTVSSIVASSSDYEYIEQVKVRYVGQLS